MRKPDGFCPCGCGVQTPINVHSVWHNGEPYWAWECLQPACDRLLSEQRNQSGDAECPWCHAQRRFVGHFTGKHHDGHRDYRLTVKGERVWHARRDKAPQFLVNA